MPKIASFVFDQAEALRKFILSFRHREWMIEDYPVRIIDHGRAAGCGRLTPLRWTVQVINWSHLRGDADTREEAFKQLENHLDEHRRQHGILPRPGTGRKLVVEFAAAGRIDANADLVADLMQRVLGMDPGSYFVSDESTLWDFHSEADNMAYAKKILILYRVDISDMNPPFLWAIAERIRAQLAS